MTTPDSSSTAESSMDDDTGSDNHRRLKTAPTANSNVRSRRGAEQEDDEETDKFPEVWSNLSENFRQVQLVLDRNRVLIQQVNENHRSKIHSNLVKNVALIQEINGNISKVVSLYSDLSANFSSVFQHGDGPQA